MGLLLVCVSFLTCRLPTGFALRICFGYSGYSGHYEFLPHDVGRHGGHLEREAGTLGASVHLPFSLPADGN